MSYKKVIEFENGYGLSIVSNDYSYGGNDGLFEIALLQNEAIIYNAELGFADVVGYLDFHEVAEIIERVKKF